jgi:signal transduction histidine kinase
MAWWAPLAALYEVAVQRERRVSAWAAVGACVLAYLAQLVGLPQETWVLVTSAFWYPALFAVPWWLGDRARRRRERERLLDRRERERALRTVADERARLARDLHDLLAQSIGVMVATASAGRGSRDGDAARVEEALARIEETGRASMAEVRRLLAMLRGDVPAPVPDPQPGLDDLDDLLGQVRRQGLAVTVAREGEPRPLDPSVDLSAHRIVQEAFANVLRHAGQTRVDLRIAYDRECVRIEVRDHGGGHPWAADAGEGTGLLGLRERALLVGGSLSAEALPGGGFRVVADLPLAAAR